MSDVPEPAAITFGRLTHLLLGNFKAFGRRQRIPIRPITLIYGRNNSGKSSIIQALLYAEHARRTGDLMPDVVLKDGRPVLEGGVKRLVHGRTSKTVCGGYRYSLQEAAGRYYRVIRDQ